MTKRTLSLLLVIAMICSLGVMAMADDIAVSQVSLDKHTATAYVGGDTLTLQATVGPSNATNQSITWTSSDEAIATVTGGVVTAVAPGTAIITATSESNSSAKDSCTVTVEADKVQSVVITGNGVTNNALYINPSESVALTATTTYASGKTSTSASWVSSDMNTVSYTLAGTACTITGAKTGNATITATGADGKTTAVINVTVYTVDSVTVTGPSTVSAGGSITLTATAKTTPSNGVQTKAATWASTNSSSFTLTDNKNGTATIKANADATSKDNTSITATIGTTSNTPPFVVTVTDYTATAPTFTTPAAADNMQYYALVGGTMPTLTVAATAPNGTTSYQWYSNTSASTTGGTAVTTGSGKTSASYSPSLSSAGTYYFYCIATNKDNAGKTASSASRVFIVTVHSQYEVIVTPAASSVNVGSSLTLTATPVMYTVSSNNRDCSPSNQSNGYITWSIGSQYASYLSFSPSSSVASTTSTISSQSPSAYIPVYGRSLYSAGVTVTATYSVNSSSGTSLIKVVGAATSITAGVPANGSAFGMGDTNSATPNSVVEQIKTAITGVDTGYVIFDTTTASGSYYGVFSAVSGTRYYLTSSISNWTEKQLSSVTFTPGSAEGVYSIGYKAYASNGVELATGTLSITVSNTAGNADIYYNTTTNGTVGLSEQDFIDWFQAQHTSSYVLQSVKFNNLPSSGTMYCGGSRVNTSTTYYTANYLTSTSYKALADLSYTASSAVGCYAVGFTCTGKASSSSSASTVTNSGTMYLCVTKSGVGTVSYNVYTGTNTSLAESDFTSVYKTATGVTTSSPKFSIRIITAPSMGTLYRSGSTSSAYKIAKSQSTNYYVNASTSGSYNVRDITYVPGNYTSGKDTVVYGAYDSNGTLQYIGNLVFNYGTKNSSLTTYSEGYTFKTSDFVKSTDTDPVVTVQFTSTTAGGYLYRDYTHGTGTSVKTTDKFYTSSAVYGNYGISTVTFIPTAGNTSTVTIGFKATTKSGKTNTGTITMVCSVRASALKFSDVGYNWSWAVGAVDYASSWGIVGGMGNGFQPGTTMNRAMLVTVLYRIAGSPSVSGTNPFKDVKSGTFYYSAVIWAYRNGIVTGKTANTFDPNGAVTRQEIAAILWRYAGSPSGSGSLYGYTDASSVSSYAVSAMQWAVGSGVISGKGTRLAPKDSGTRAEVTVMLHRYLAK